MKKSVLKLVAIAMVAIVVCLAFASCGKKLSGKYESLVLESGSTMEFKGNKVTVTFLAVGVELASIDGTYEINDDKITFDFVDESDVKDEDAKELLSKLNGELTFEEGDDYIKIGVTKYNKAEK